MKRVFDIIIAAIGLLLLAPIFIIIGVLIYLNDKGPIIFKQKRVGRNGKKFIIYKFRSMKMLEYVEEGVFEAGNTSRVTSMGKFLRKNKLDELPQLINILIGNMSFVGPRPEVEKWVAIYPERWKIILTIRPGITDNASIMFRNEESVLSKNKNPEIAYKEVILPKKLDLYEAYVLNHSFFGDLAILFRTIFSLTIKR